MKSGLSHAPGEWSHSARRAFYFAGNAAHFPQNKRLRPFHWFCRDKSLPKSPAVPPILDAYAPSHAYSGPALTDSTGSHLFKSIRFICRILITEIPLRLTYSYFSSPSEAHSRCIACRRSTVSGSLSGKRQRYYFFLNGLCGEYNIPKGARQSENIFHPPQYSVIYFCIPDL